MPVYQYAQPGKGYYEEKADKLFDAIAKCETWQEAQALIIAALLEAWGDGKAAADHAEIGW